MIHNHKPSIVFFIGPTISEIDVMQACAGVNADIRILPPVRQGDLLRLADNPPTVIGMIDGYFKQAPAVLHKEIMLLLESGVRILGAASLGALRAAELDHFGMEGVGTIYQMYKDGHIDGDDEVALMHASAEDRYRKLSDPLINIRQTFLAAYQKGVDCKQTLDRLLKIAKKMPFVKRTYSALSQSDILSPEQAIAFRQFTRHHSLDTKRTDALQLVETIARRMRGDESWPSKVVHSLQRTKYFKIMEKDYRGLEIAGRHISDAEVLTFLKLFSRTWPQTVEEVLWRCLAVDEARDQRMQETPVETLIAQFRQQQKLVKIDEFRRWLKNRSIALDDLQKWLTDLDLASRIENSYRTNYPRDSHKKCRERLRVDVAKRVGVSVRHLSDVLFMRPGILWDSPFLRETKISGEFTVASKSLSILLAAAEEYWRGKPDLKNAFEALSFRARPQVEKWLAMRWGVNLKSLSNELRRRWVVRYGEFLELARLASFFEQLVPQNCFALPVENNQV